MEHYPFVDDLPNQHGHFPWLCQITRRQMEPDWWFKNLQSYQTLLANTRIQ